MAYQAAAPRYPWQTCEHPRTTRSESVFLKRQLGYLRPIYLGLTGNDSVGWDEVGNQITARLPARGIAPIMQFRKHLCISPHLGVRLWRIDSSITTSLKGAELAPVAIQKGYEWLQDNRSLRADAEKPRLLPARHLASRPEV